MSDQRNEKPTQKRLDKSREEGRFPVSRDLIQAAQFLAFTIIITNLAPEWIERAGRATKQMFHLAFIGELTPNGFVTLFGTHLLKQLGSTVLAGLSITLTALVVQLASTQFGLAPSKLAPDFKRLNPVSKLTSLGPQNLMQALKAIVLFPILIFAVWLAIRQNLEAFLSLPFLSVRPGLIEIGIALKRLLWYGATLLLIAGIFDWTWQKHQLSKSLKMSKQEIRDEGKESEGNPEIKGRLRRAQRELARRNMMKDVNKATAVIVNPTHYAVAIHYQIEGSSAPRIVAKGQDFLALRIRQRALDLQIPIVENKPLAQALYKSVEVGQEIPPHLYRAVAEILAYIYRIMNGKLPG